MHGGKAVAALLRGSWRTAAAAPDAAPDVLADANARLQQTGCGGLAWWRIKDSPLARTAAGASLRDAFRVQTLDAAANENALAIALGTLKAVGIEPIVAKGWAVARHYPAKGLRPYGDHDVFVEPAAYDAAERAVRDFRDPTVRVDLHAGFRGGWPTWDDATACARVVPTGDTSVRVLGPEHQIGMLSSHLLSHGAWRPLWLCDIGLLIEIDGHRVDWDRVAAWPKRVRDETRVAVRLAHEVLEADIGATPWSGDQHRLPGWIGSALLAAWATEHYSTTSSIRLERSWGGRARSLAVRWPNGIEVTHRWGAPYNAWPRFPLQLLDLGARAVRSALGRSHRVAHQPDEVIE